MHRYYLNSAMLYQCLILKTISHPHLLERSGFIQSLVPLRRLIMTRQPPQVSLIRRYFPNLTMLYPVPDVEDQHAQPPSTTEHSFPVIVVDGTYDPLLMDELKNLKALILTHFCKDLATMVWNWMLSSPGQGYESGQRGRVGLGQTEGESIGCNDRRGKR